MQETFSKPEDEKIWTAEWGGKGFFSHGTEHSKGVTGLINLASKFQVSIVALPPFSDHITTCELVCMPHLNLSTTEPITLA